MNDWRFELSELFKVTLPELDNVEFANRWVTIIGGVITVSQKYAWNGIVPTAFNFLINVLGWLTLAGRKSTNPSLAQYASLVFDVLRQFRSQLPVTKSEALAVFKKMLAEAGVSKFKIAWYSFFLALFSPNDWVQDTTVS